MRVGPKSGPKAPKEKRSPTVERSRRHPKEDRIDESPNRAAESIAAARWFNSLEEAIYTLEHLPRRCPLAPENKKTRLPLRHLLYGRKPNVYRVIYEIDQPRRTVRVLTIRHGAMDGVELADL